MSDLNMDSFVELYNSDEVKEHAMYMVITVIDTDTDSVYPEIIINVKENFESKMEYYQKAYTKNLSLRNQPSIVIQSYGFFRTLNHAFNL